eukprot:COSAG01_NODE_587_length_15149_cov_13.592558_11_plen_183_part_00
MSTRELRLYLDRADAEQGGTSPPGELGDDSSRPGEQHEATGYGMPFDVTSAQEEEHRRQQQQPPPRPHRRPNHQEHPRAAVRSGPSTQEQQQQHACLALTIAAASRAAPDDVPRHPTPEESLPPPHLLQPTLQEIAEDVANTKQVLSSTLVHQQRLHGSASEGSAHAKAYMHLADKLLPLYR